LTQKELAEAVGVSRQAITNYETDIRVPDPETTRALATVLNTTMSYLYGETLDPRPLHLRGEAAHDKRHVYDPKPALDPEDALDIERAIQILERLKKKG